MVYTDGSAERGGKGHGGWAAIIRAGFDIVEIHGGAKASTVNRMEIIAAVVALEILPAGCAITLHTDSKYLRNGITQWIDGWKRNGWMTVAREPVKNADLWRRLDTARDCHQVTWRWVKAHAGNPSNERADELAKFARHSITKGF
ncbi:ribonuclease HI [Afipia carboxidovorans]|uniref:ribonuclease HI n=1 Tax=Afipia carboxidovorans TaxID=40137 RepID=UPI0030CEBD8A